MPGPGLTLTLIGSNPSQPQPEPGPGLTLTDASQEGSSPEEDGKAEEGSHRLQGLAEEAWGILHGACLASSVKAPLRLAKGASRAFRRVEEALDQLWHHKVLPTCRASVSYSAAFPSPLQPPSLEEAERSGALQVRDVAKAVWAEFGYIRRRAASADMSEEHTEHHIRAIGANCARCADSAVGHAWDQAMLKLKRLVAKPKGCLAADGRSQGTMQDHFHAGGNRALVILNQGYKEACQRIQRLQNQMLELDQAGGLESLGNGKSPEEDEQAYRGAIKVAIEQGVEQCRALLRTRGVPEPTQDEAEDGAEAPKASAKAREESRNFLLDEFEAQWRQVRGAFQEACFIHNREPELGMAQALALWKAIFY